MGGEPVDLAWEFHKTTEGVLRHPGDHPAFEGHIRWGRLADGRRWVESSIRSPDGSYGHVGGWTFEAERDSEQAIVEIQATRPDDRWERRPVDPGMIGRRPEP